MDRGQGSRPYRTTVRGRETTAGVRVWTRKPWPTAPMPCTAAFAPSRERRVWSCTTALLARCGCRFAVTVVRSRPGTVTTTGSRYVPPTAGTPSVSRRRPGRDTRSCGGLSGARGSSPPSVPPDALWARKGGVPRSDADGDPELPPLSEVRGMARPSRARRWPREFRAWVLPAARVVGRGGGDRRDLGR